MATSQPSILVSRSSDTNFRNLIIAIHAALAAIGLVQTSDTGQINTATVTFPVGVNTYKGYSCWRMNDALQGTYPVYFKLEFGTGATYATLCVAITAGTGIDGAGNLTGTVGARLGISGMSADSSVSTTCYFSGDTNRFVMLLRTNGSGGCIMFLERLHASDGTDLNTGIAYGAGPASASVIGTWTTAFYSGVQVVEFGLAVPPMYYGWPSLCPSSGASAYATTNTSANVVNMIPTYPIGWTVHNPLISVWTYLNGDIASMTPFTSTLYGTSRSMLPVGGSETPTGWASRLTGTNSDATNMRASIANF